MAKRNTPRRPTTMGAERASLIGFNAAHIAPRIKAAHGLASALVAIYQPRLERAEENAKRLGGSSGDHAVAYAQACHQAQELRGLVAIAKAAAEELRSVDYNTGRLLALTKGFAK